MQGATKSVTCSPYFLPCNRFAGIFGQSPPEERGHNPLLGDLPEKCSGEWASPSAGSAEQVLRTRTTGMPTNQRRAAGFPRGRGAAQPGRVQRGQPSLAEGTGDVPPSSLTTVAGGWVGATTIATATRQHPGPGAIVHSQIDTPPTPVGARPRCVPVDLGRDFRAKPRKAIAPCSATMFATGEPHATL